MKNCKDCKYADWDKTKSGRLHPSGDGRCTFPWKIPALPASMYWIGKNSPTPNGGSINRKKRFKDHCPYYGRIES